MRRLLPLSAVLVLAACGGGSDGRGVFEQAEEALGRVDALRAHLVVHALATVERTETIRRSDLPLERIDLSRWARDPHTFACGPSRECARADLDVEAAADDLEPVLPDLPIDADNLESAKIEVTLDDRGELRRVTVRCELQGADVEAELEPV